MEQTRAERKLRKRKLEEAIPELPGDIDATEEKGYFNPTQDTNIKPSKKRKHDESTKNDAAHTIASDRTVLAKSTKKGLKRGKNGDWTGHESTTALNDGLLATEEPGMGIPRGLKLTDDGRGVDSVHQVGSATMDDAPSSKKSKKERKAERKAKEAKAAAGHPLASLPVEDAVVISNEASPAQNSKKNNRNREKKRRKNEGSQVAEKKGAKATRFIVFVGLFTLHMPLACSYC
jgi:nucleolar protein 6